MEGHIADDASGRLNGQERRMDGQDRSMDGQERRLNEQDRRIDEQDRRMDGGQDDDAERGGSSTASPANAQAARFVIFLRLPSRS